MCLLTSAGFLSWIKILWARTVDSISSTFFLSKWGSLVTRMQILQRYPIHPFQLATVCLLVTWGVYSAPLICFFVFGWLSVADTFIWENSVVTGTKYRVSKNVLGHRELFLQFLTHTHRYFTRHKYGECFQEKIQSSGRKCPSCLVINHKYIKLIHKCAAITVGEVIRMWTKCQLKQGTVRPLNIHNSQRHTFFNAVRWMIPNFRRHTIVVGISKASEGLDK